MAPLEIKTDPMGFPMVWVDEVESWVHYLPVTKIQWEYFLCDTADVTFDAAWYQHLCELNPRVTPSAVGLENYWQALLTGLLPTEAQAFARWCGNDYLVPDLNSWHTAYKALKRLPPEPLDWDQELPSLALRGRTLLRQLDAASALAISKVGYERTLADQMLLRMGALEWVEDGGAQQGWGGMGELYPSFHGLLFTPDHGRSARPSHALTERLDHYGVRLFRRP